MQMGFFGHSYSSIMWIRHFLIIKPPFLILLMLRSCSLQSELIFFRRNTSCCVFVSVDYRTHPHLLLTCDLYVDILSVTENPRSYRHKCNRNSYCRLKVMWGCWRNGWYLKIWFCPLVCRLLVASVLRRGWSVSLFAGWWGDKRWNNILLVDESVN